MGRLCLSLGLHCNLRMAHGSVDCAAPGLRGTMARDPRSLYHVYNLKALHVRSSAAGRALERLADGRVGTPLRGHGCLEGLRQGSASTATHLPLTLSQPPPAATCSCRKQGAPVVRRDRRLRAPHWPATSRNRCFLIHGYRSPPHSPRGCPHLQQQHHHALCRGPCRHHAAGKKRRIHRASDGMAWHAVAACRGRKDQGRNGWPICPTPSRPNCRASATRTTSVRCPSR